MLFVVTSAKPAELILAVLTSHVHATLVLLNVCFALRTRLGIQLKPNIIVVITAIDSVVPFGQKVTREWPVSLFNTLETPVIPTQTVDVSLFSGRVVCEVGAVGSWAPLHLFADVYKRLLVVLSILVIALLVYQFLEHLFRDNELARRQWADCCYAVWASLNLSVKISLIALKAKSVLTFHPNGLKAFHVADWT